MATNCVNQKKNMLRCTCTYSDCDKHGVCYECIHIHLSMKELPACVFSPEAEATYDRSFRKFVSSNKHQIG